MESESSDVELDLNQPVTQRHIMKIKKDVAESQDDVINFGMQLLGAGKVQVKGINSDDPTRRIDHKFANICHTWMQKEGDRATIGLLLAALRSIDMEGTAKKILLEMEGTR